MSESRWTGREVVGPLSQPDLRTEGEVVFWFWAEVKKLNERLGERVTAIRAVQRPADGGDGWVVKVETEGRDTSLRVPEKWIREGPPGRGRDLTPEERAKFGGWATTGRGSR